MPKSANQKLKLLYMMQYLLERSDENHPLSREQIQEMLISHDITVERKSFYSDIEALRTFGLDIINVKGKTPGYIESFNGSFRDECLNMNWFMSLEDARDKIERWRRDYNEFRPHSALTYLTPAEFARKMGSEAV